MDFASALGLYLWPLLAALLGGAALSLIGTQVAARNESALVLVVNQVTVCTYLAIMFVAEMLHLSSAGAWGDVSKVLAITAGVASLKALERVAWRRNESLLPYHIGLFLGLLALSHLFASLNTSFEGQMLRSLMGDIILIADTRAIVLLILSALALFFCTLYGRESLLRSFTRTILGIPESVVGRRLALPARAAEIYLLGFLCLCAIEMGFLLSSAAVLVPTQLLCLSSASGIGRHIKGVLLVWVSACLSGFSLSLAVPKLPTAPAIVVALFVFGSIILAWQSLTRHKGQERKTTAGERKTW